MHKLFSTISIFLLALFTTTLNVEAQLQGNYPPLDTPPPPVASWTALVDQTKLPNAPIRPPGTPCPPTDEFCVWSCTTCTRPDIDFSFCPNKGDWALTYDDGPTNNTLKVLDALNARGLKATFFAIGSRVVESPQILKQVVDAGHQVGVHTWSHTALTSQTTEEVIAEIKWTEMAIKQAVGLTPKWFRAPQGDMDDRVRGILKQLGYRIAFWNHDTNDWMSNSDPTFDLNWIPANFTIWVQNTTATTGFASLEHDAFNKSSSMAESAMDIVLKANFKPQSVSVCTGDKPYVENVTLLPSNINGQNSTSTGTSTAEQNNVSTSTVTETSAKQSPKNNASSTEQNLFLGIVCGLAMVIFI
ncbi:carbohydrate esterase family 4 protein [Rhizophagus clarus]|uniref:Carbohydrate esterase family 4 protein n=1 Tax=Rhizophagus clarus TaxID=94130 RepID=A0A8H3LF79_9GLOM|nr:carbohydrate esterase family 4 protein [Rhizophagus clarus]